MRHDVVAQLVLQFCGKLIVDIVQMCAHLVKLLVRDIQTELLLTLGEGKPEPAPG